MKFTVWKPAIGCKSADWRRRLDHWLGSAPSNPGFFIVIVCCPIMPKHVRAGEYYEFNRPSSSYEVGREIPVFVAQADVRFGRDVYTLRSSDAKSLAKNVSKLSPVWNADYFLIV